MTKNELQVSGLAGTNQGLNGFWRSLWKGVKRVVEVAADLGIPFAGLVENGMNYVDGGTCRLPPSYPNPLFTCRSTELNRNYILTAQENAQVIAWADQYFAPFYDKLIKEINEIFSEGTTLDKQLIIINSAIKKMSLFNAYLTTNPNNFSINANKEQLNGVADFFSYIENILNEIVYKADFLLEQQAVQVSSTGISFSPFTIPHTNTTASIFRIADEVNIPANTTLPTLQADSTGSSNSQTSNNTSSGLKIFLGIIAAAFVIKLAISEGEPEETVSN